MTEPEHIVEVEHKDKQIYFDVLKRETVFAATGTIKEKNHQDKAPYVFTYIKILNCTPEGMIQPKGWKDTTQKIEIHYPYLDREKENKLKEAILQSAKDLFLDPVSNEQMIDYLLERITCSREYYDKKSSLARNIDLVFSISVALLSGLMFFTEILSYVTPAPKDLEFGLFVVVMGIYVSLSRVRNKYNGKLSNLDTLLVRLECLKRDLPRITKKKFAIRFSDISDRYYEVIEDK